MRQDSFPRLVSGTGSGGHGQSTGRSNSRGRSGSRDRLSCKGPSSSQGRSSSRGRSGSRGRSSSRGHSSSRKRSASRGRDNTGNKWNIGARPKIEGRSECHQQGSTPPTDKTNVPDDHKRVSFVDKVSHTHPPDCLEKPQGEEDGMQEKHPGVRCGGIRATIYEFPGPQHHDATFPTERRRQAGQSVRVSRVPGLRATSHLPVRERAHRVRALPAQADSLRHLREATCKIRNRAMEKLAWHVSFPCKYELFGCPKKLSPVEKLEHDQVCDFGLCPCILGLDSCAWQGSLHEVVAHIDKKHSFVPRFQGERIVICAGGFNRPEPFGWVALQSCFGHDFVVQMRKYQHGLAPLQHRFFAAVQLVGSRREALKFGWRFELRNRYQRLALDARALSVHDSIQPMQSGNGVIIEMDTVKVFADGSNLNIGVSIFSRTLS
ncbi:hypothetical protein V5799_011385 [Amblyomma americanum]|uniref:E3 ubiquitin-protein ligase n=2 Tax=Amblyomma americanum TaxID=6943 RepID=A0AAQ4EH88_AMBAM